MKTTDKKSTWPDAAAWHRIEAAAGAPVRVIGRIEFETGEHVIIVEREPLPDVRDLVRKFRLTEREAQIARLLADRPTNTELALALGISLHTVRKHVEQVLAKLQVGSRNDVRHRLAEIVPPAT